MKKLTLALPLCLSVLFFTFGEDFLTSDFLTYREEYSQPREKNIIIPNPQAAGQIPRKNANRHFAGLGKQPVELANNSDISVIEDWAFAYTDLLAVNIPEGVTVIGKGAFANNTLSSVSLPLSLQTIDEWAFAHNNISSVVFPENVISIGEYAFWGNKVTEVTLGSFVQLSRETIDNEFYEAYNKEKNVAGHYIKKEGIWLRE
jgi:hypothetical protein